MKIFLQKCNDFLFLIQESQQSPTPEHLTLQLSTSPIQSKPVYSRPLLNNHITAQPSLNHPLGQPQVGVFPPIATSQQNVPISSTYQISTTRNNASTLLLHTLPKLTSPLQNDQTLPRSNAGIQESTPIVIDDPSLVSSVVNQLLPSTSETKSIFHPESGMESEILAQKDCKDTGTAILKDIFKDIDRFR